MEESLQPFAHDYGKCIQHQYIFQCENHTLVTIKKYILLAIDYVTYSLILTFYVMTTLIKFNKKQTVDQGGNCAWIKDFVKGGIQPYFMQSNMAPLYQRLRVLMIFCHYK